MAPVEYVGGGGEFKVFRKFSKPLSLSVAKVPTKH